MLRLLWRAAPLLWQRWKRKAAVVGLLLAAALWSWPTSHEPHLCRLGAPEPEDTNGVRTRVEELGVLPRVSHSWVGGLAAANDPDGRVEVFVHWEATKEFDDEDYFMDAGLTRFDGNGTTRLERYTRPAGALAIAGGSLFGSSPSGVFEMARPDGPRELVTQPARVLGTWRGGVVLTRARTVLFRSPEGVERVVAELEGAGAACVCGDHLFGFHAFPPSALTQVDLATGAKREVARLPEGLRYDVGLACARPGLLYGQATERGSHVNHLVRIGDGRVHLVTSSRERPRPIAANATSVFVQRGFAGATLERFGHTTDRSVPFVTGQGHVLRAVATDRHLVWVGGDRTGSRTQFVRRAAL